MFLRSVLGGKLYFPSLRNNKNIIFVGTQNQLNSLSNIRQKLLKESTTYYHGNDVFIDDKCKNKFPFWNVESLQFMYAPAFHFTALKGCEKYRYDDGYRKAQAGADGKDDAL